MMQDVLTVFLELLYHSAVIGQALPEVGIDAVQVAEALEQLVGVGPALIDVAGADEATHQFEDLEVFLGGLGAELG
jgi:hypothetical protein